MEIERITFEDNMDSITENIMGNIDKEILEKFNERNKKWKEEEEEEIEKEKENEKENGDKNEGDEFYKDPYKGKKKFNLVTEDEIEKKGKKNKYRQTTWDQYAEEKIGEYEEAVLKGDPIKSAVTIYNIPNSEEFQELITVLKDCHGGRATEYIITSCGFGRFYNIYISTGLKDITNVIKKVKRSFYSEIMKEFDIRLTESFLKKNRSEERFNLHMSEQQKAIIMRLLQDIKVSESSFGLIMCVATFNKAKEKFEQFLTEKYEVLYEDDGYMKLINEEIDQATINGVDWLINTMPIMLKDIEVNKQQYLYDTDNPKLETKLVLKVNVVNEVIKVVESKNREISARCGLDFILHKDEIKLKQQIPVHSFGTNPELKIE